jgi:hypothetical protein
MVENLAQPTETPDIINHGQGSRDDDDTVDMIDDPRTK